MAWSNEGWSGKKRRPRAQSIYGGPIDDEEYVMLFARRVAGLLEHLPQVAPKDPAAWDALQKAQVEKVIELEGVCKRALIADPEDRGYRAYEAFCSMILDERRALGTAQPYFREPAEETFTPAIGPAIRARHIRVLYRYHVNHPFLAWARRLDLGWRETDEFVVEFQRLQRARTELISMSLPLAISRARMFYNRTPKSHLQYLDLVQLAIEGLCEGVDKYRLPWTPVFRSVCIGRMTRLFIEAYSDTVVRFLPLDRRRIYRTNKATRRLTPDGVDYTALAAVANEGLPEREHVTGDELAALMAATSPLSMSLQLSSSDSDDGGELGDRVAAPEEARPDRLFEAKASQEAMYRALSGLSLIEQKAVRLAMGLDTGL